MFAVGILVVVSAFPGPPASADWPPRTTVAELNAMVKAGNYHLVRVQKIAHLLEAVAVVDKVGRWPQLEAAGRLVGPSQQPAAKGSWPSSRAIASSSALIVDEAYMGLQLWTYSWSKEPAPEGRTSSHEVS